jgi:histidine triad (HIT) family protein
MHNHEPENYICPFCLLIQGIENEKVKSKQDDIIYKDKFVTALIASHWWPNNSGHVIIVPNEHFENIYDIPEDLIFKIHQLEKKMAVAIKETYKCDGISSRQHNEPAGGQDVWHYHLHIFPRYENDKLYENISNKNLSDPKERKIYAERLKKYFNNNSI